MMLLVGCHRPSSSAPNIHIQQQITPQPVRVGLNTITIQLAGTDALPVSRASIMVEGDMSHPGMAPVFSEARETAPGNYLAHIGFNMGGDWVLLLHIKLANGQKIERQIDVRGVRSN